MSCENAIRYQQSAFSDSWEQFSENMTVFGFFNAIEMLLDSPYHLYDLNNDCYDSLFEAGIVYDSFMAVFDDSDYVKQNLIYNFGLMYNSFKDVIFFF